MKKAPIEFDSDVFSCIQKDEFAILTLKENALKIFGLMNNNYRFEW